MPHSLVLAVLLFAADPAADPAVAPPPADAARIVDLRTGKDVSLDALAAELAGYDVLFLGEQHDNAVGHRAHHRLLELVQRERSDVVLSLEMFERDVQGVLDDHLAGRIDEETFLKHARPWTEHAEFYRPFLEFAREHRLDVIAGNLPRSIASKVAKGEEPTLAERAFLPRRTTAPAGRYRELFVETMRDHVGTDEPEKMERYFRSQCLKDDAMAEAITDYLTARPHRSPLVVHVCGAFHVDEGRGTVERVLSRAPLLRTAVLSMEAVESPGDFDPSTAKARAHWLLVVPSPPGEDDESTPKGERGT